MRTNLMKGLFLLAICLSACTEKILKENSNRQNDFPVLSASEILNNLGNSFKNISEDSAEMQMQSANVEGDLVYPDYYGVVYLDEDGNVIVLVKGEPEGFAEEFRKRTRSCNVIVHSCEYSYNELVTLVDSLNAIFLNDALCNELGWTGIGIDTEKNRVMIDLLPLTEGAKRRFKNQVCRSSAIEFKKGGISVMDATTNMGGVR